MATAVNNTVFTPTRLLYVAAHGNNMNNRSAVYDLSAFLPSQDWANMADPVTPAEEIIDAAAAASDTDPSANNQPRPMELCTITRSGVFNQTFTINTPESSSTTPGSTLATFHVPISYHASIPITISPLPTIPSPQPIKLSPNSVLTRGQKFTYNSAVHTWTWTSAASVELVKSTGGGVETVMALARMADKFYRSGGVVLIGPGDGNTEDEHEEWLRVVISSLEAVWRREREVRYGFPGWKRKEKRAY